MTHVARRSVLAFLALPLASRAALAQSPYAAFGSHSRTPLFIGGSRLDIAIAPAEYRHLSADDLTGWIGKSATAMATYYGHLPAPVIQVLIEPAPGAGVRFGQAFGHRGALVRYTVGLASTTVHLELDWKGVHELVHLAFPRLDRRHNWLAEGLATYVEPIARLQSGHLPEAFVWRELARDMPKGLPGDGDRGLDHTPTWSRTYWGGALFCLLADVEIRKRTGNRLGLQHALRAVSAAASYEQHWPIARALALADSATGIDVLAELYAEHRDKPVTPDLAALWRDLGVRLDGRLAVLDDAAPLAQVRQGIARGLR